MGIVYDAKRRAFHLQTNGMSYVMGVNDAGKLLSIYWGAKLPSLSCADGLLAQSRRFDALTGVGTGAVRPEYRCQEPHDYGEPALLAVHGDGVRTTRLSVVSHDIKDDTLKILLRDEAYPFEVELVYKLFGGLDLVSRRAVIRNIGEESVTLDIMKSATVNLPSRESYRINHFSGSWGAEFRRETLPTTQGQFVLESHRLTCATHQHTPFVALDVRGEATETTGEVFFGALQWSGDFKITVEQEYNSMVSVTAGVNDFDCALKLAKGESFETPAFVIGYSGSGFEKMTEILYDWQFDYLSPRRKANTIRPIIYNSWYPYEFDINEENLLGLIGKAKDIGAELFVIDDGWMPKRFNSKAGLGDWRVDEARFPHGFQTITDACHEAGLLFGLWVEPEMVNPDSDLYRAHPDWVICDPTRPRSEKRNQLVLDMSREDVCLWCMGWLDELIETYRLDYLKWDMNRYVTEPGTNRELPVRYIQNIYRIWEHLNAAHPAVLYENCASGGGRADFGMVPYADRINRSDNAHPEDVMVLHEGFSRLFVPKTAGGAGNIAKDPNVPLPFRIHLGMTGSMSIGIDLLKADEKTLAMLKEATAAFKLVRADLQDAYVYRLASATEHPYVVWQYVRRDRRAFGVFLFAHNVHEWDKCKTPWFRMRGLREDGIYADEAGGLHSGAELMNVGMPLPVKIGDYTSCFRFFREG